MNNVAHMDGRAARNRNRRRAPDRRPKPSGTKARSGPNGPKANLRNGQRSQPRTDPRKNFDRYTALAREALSSGDAIEAENYHQHAEHYFRLMNQPSAPGP